MKAFAYEIKNKEDMEVCGGIWFAKDILQAEQELAKEAELYGYWLVSVEEAKC